MKLDEKQLHNVLVKGNYVTEEDFDKAVAFAKKHRVAASEYFLTEGLLTKDLLGQALAESYQVPYADLNSYQPTKEWVQRIPEPVARAYHAIAFTESADTIVITTDNPQNAQLTAELAKIFPGKKLQLAYSLTEDIEAGFVHYRKPLETRFAKIIKEDVRVAPNLIVEIFEDALTVNASDIHFEPTAKDILVRFRVDGVLYDAGRFPKSFYENILNRVKVQAYLRIDEHFAAQDGSMRYERSSGRVDMRVSVVPTIDGEKIVIRVLAHYVRSYTLGDIGLSSSDRKNIEAASKKPFGMILVTGPTGSGKTTTLYTLVKLLNDPEVNITTVEDPVEYKIEGVNQIQVNVQTNLTFAKGLRSIIRQDPDIILVGEIRDEETAGIAVNAALTGHLLLSTFHANDAASAIPRLLDMNIEPFLLASTLDLIVAQRLVRHICDQCRYSYTATPRELVKYGNDVAQFFTEKSLTLYRGKGCSSCNNIGYKGRTAVFELIRNTQALQALILTNPSSQQIWRLARNEGARSMFEDGVDKVKAGLTTIDELLRVVAPPSNGNA
jgi:type II secretory ATPase GspE/PulE/Tfp pilus assembly ATPase PilB-like protein